MYSIFFTAGFLPLFGSKKHTKVSSTVYDFAFFLVSCKLLMADNPSPFWQKQNKV